MENEPAFDPLANDRTRGNFYRKVRVVEPTLCWVWTGSTNHLGYGRVMVTTPTGRRLMAAHRLAYTHAHGAIPEGQVVMHTCDNPGCVNPRHLKLGTQQDNLEDMRQKGRNRRCYGPRLSPELEGLREEALRMGVRPTRWAE